MFLKKIKSLSSKADKIFISKYLLISVIGYTLIFFGLYFFIDILNFSKTVSFIIIYAINYIIIYNIQLNYLFKTKHESKKLIKFIIYLLTFYLLANFLFNVFLKIGFLYLISTALTIIILFPLRLLILKKVVYKD